MASEIEEECAAVSGNGNSATDVKANRAAQKWTRKEQIGRILWTLVQPFFRWSPRPFWGWRRLILRVFGARVGKNVHVYPSVHVTIPWNITLGQDCAVGHAAILYALGPIRIGERTTISQYAHLCAGSHNYLQPDMPLTKPPISIGADCWIAAGAFVCPNVTISDRSVIGARSVVTKDIPSDVVVAGNPAKIISKQDEK